MSNAPPLSNPTVVDSTVVDSTVVDSTVVGTPVAEVEIDVDLVSTLLASQHPDLTDLPLVEVDSGWDNAMFRLGDRLAVRLPRRASAAAFIDQELYWLPRLAPRFTLPAPVPERIGRPQHGYPWSWSVVPWLEGSPADLDPPRADQASVLADFLLSVHREPSPGAPHNASRGVPLGDRADSVAPRFRRVGAETDALTPEVLDAWRAGCDAPKDIEPTWIHGDLHPRNVLARDGALCAVIDWGDLTAGDAATDLAAVWMLLPTVEARREALERYGGTAGLTAATVDRARGWAVFFGVVLLDAGRIDEPRHAAVGAETLARVTAGP